MTSRMPRKAPSLSDFRRIVVKVGSSLLVDSDGGRLHDDWLSALAQDIAALQRGKRDLPTVKVITAYRGLKHTVFGPGAPFGVYADVVTPGRVRIGDTLRLR